VVTIKPHGRGHWPSNLSNPRPPSLQNATPMPCGIHNSRRGPKPRPPQEAAARRRAALKRARQKQLAKEKTARADHRRQLGRTQIRNCPAAFSLSRSTAVGAGLSIVRRTGAPLLTYIDHTGTVRREDYRSAEQLIQDYQREHRAQTKPHAHQ